MSSASPEFILTSDEGDDWYVIPADKYDDWCEWEALDTDEEERWTPPKWAVYVQDPGHVFFKEWRSTL